MEENEKRIAPKVFESEYKMCLLLWENEPIRAADLARLCDKELDWSRTTTYTVIKRPEERGILCNEGGVVHSIYSKEEVRRAEMEEMLKKTFRGSVPAFVAAFIKNRKPDPEEIAGIRAFIDAQ